MRILVTGGSGFIGSHVVRQALAAGHYVTNLDCLTYAANPENNADIQSSDAYSFVRADIKDAAAVASAFETYMPDAVIHLAAESHVDRSIDGPDDFISTNIVGTFTLLSEARRYLDRHDHKTFRFLHVSTDEVYGDLTETDPAFSETTAYDPSSPYSASKAASDHLVRAWGRTFGLPILITNCSNNYGPNQFPEKLIPVVILNCLRGSPIPVYGKGENIRDWLYVEDHADALLTVLERGSLGETYNIGGNNERRNIELVRTICEIMDRLSPRGDGKPHSSAISFVHDRPGHDRRYAIDASKIESELGWTPNTSFDDGFEKTVAWYLNNEDWWRPLVERREALARRGKA